MSYQNVVYNFTGRPLSHFWKEDLTSAHNTIRLMVFPQKVMRFVVFVSKSNDSEVFFEHMGTHVEISCFSVKQEVSMNTMMFLNGK